MNDYTNDPTQRSARLKAFLQQRLRQAATATRAHAIPRRAGGAATPLSFAQQRLWFMDHLQPGNPAYNRPTPIHLRGALDRAVLENSLNEIVRRHEILRTSFSAIDGQPVQTVAPSLTVGLPVIDLSNMPAHEQHAEISRIAVDEAQQSFDLSRLPLLTVKLVRLGETEHFLFLTLHHIVFDGWSAGILIRELATLYQSLSGGEPSSLPGPPIQYADFACWQRQRMQGGMLESQLTYWKTKLGGQLPLLELPTDRPRPPIQTFRGARHRLLLPLNFAASLKSLSQREGATLFMTMLAAFQALLHRYTGGDDIIVGVPIAGRTRIEVEQLIGVFINTLALRTDLSGNPSFRQLLGRVRNTALEAYAHQELPFEKLVEELQPVRDLSRMPVFQVLFQLRNLTGESADTNQDLRMAEADFDGGSAKLDLAVDIVDNPEGLSCVAEYNTDLFDAASIARLLNHYETLLRGILDNPDARLSVLPLLTEVERGQLLIDWNDTATGYPRHRCTHELFEAQVEKTPDAIALVFPSAGSGQAERQLSYQDLNARANRLTHHLIALGVGPEVLVALLVERSLEMVVALLGILKAGGAYLPLDPAYPKERLAFMLEDSKAQVLITQSNLKGALPEHHTQCLFIDQAEAFDRYPVTNPKTAVAPDNLAYVIYTSGSTGTPKGVAVTHDNLINYTRFIYDKLGLEQKHYAFATVSTLSADGGNTSIFPSLVSGGCLHVVGYEVATDAALFADYVARHPIDVLKIAVSHLKALLDSDAAILPREYLIFGGEASSWQLIEQIMNQQATCRVINHYGPTETTIGSLTFDLDGQRPDSATVPIGRPIANTEVYLLDPHLNPVPVGVPGELHIGGAGLARGYVGRPELTAEKFIPNRFRDEAGARLYKTGDLARYLADGNIEFLGRIDHQVKVRGFRIELGEIEAVLAKHPDVNACGVIAREDNPGDKRLVAYVVPAHPPQIPPTPPFDKLRTGSFSKGGEIPPGSPSGSPLLTDGDKGVNPPLKKGGWGDSRSAHEGKISALRDHLKAKLPDYMVPSAFVLLDALPLTPNGKLDRKALPAPEYLSEASFVAPRTPSEQTLVNIFAEVLKLDRIGIHDSFFDLGGHSLLATQVISRVRVAFNIDLPLRSLFELPTIAELGPVIAQKLMENMSEEELAKLLNEVEAL